MRRISRTRMVLIVGLLGLHGCSSAGGKDEATDATDAGGKADDAKNGDVVFLDQGWSNEERSWMYHASEGSKMVPRDWLVALEDDAGGRWIDSLDGYGLIADPANDANPDGLPVGLAVEGDHVGATCTVCHTSQLRFGGTTVRLEGGSMQADFMGFQLGLRDQVRQTLEDPKAFEAFAARVLSDSAEDEAIDGLREEMAAWLDEMLDRLSYLETAIQGGPGRQDGIGQPRNETFCIDFEMPENCTPWNPPTNPGFLWALGDLSWFQSHGAVHRPLARNIAQAMGTYADTQILDRGASVDVPIMNLVELEEGFEALSPPNWEDPGLREILPPLDQSAVQRGEDVFAQTCGECHGNRSDGPFTEANAFGRTFVEVPVTPLEEIGTDPAFVRAFLEETALAPARLIEAMPEAYEERFGTLDASRPVNAAALRQLLLQAAIDAFVAENQELIASIGLDRLSGFREFMVRTPEQIRGYRAQPLEGIAFTGPFLHNGSVPTLADLLEPSEERPREFFVGGIEFDPEAVGFITDPSEPNAYLFDTTLEGNSNAGHEGPQYGTELSERDKQDLLEYLKSL